MPAANVELLGPGAAARCDDALELMVFGLAAALARQADVAEVEPTLLRKVQVRLTVVTGARARARALEVGVGARPATATLGGDLATLALVLADHLDASSPATLTPARPHDSNASMLAAVAACLRVTARLPVTLLPCHKLCNTVGQ